MSVRFSEANDRIAYSGAGLPNPADGFTLLCWAWLSVDLNNYQTFARLFAGSTVATFATTLSGTGGPAYYSPAGQVESGTEIGVGVWRRVGISRTGNTGRVFIGDDDVGSALAAATGSITTTTAPTGIAFGGRAPGDATEWLNGREAQARIFSRELSLAECEAEFASWVPLAADLAAWWPLSVHTDLTDHSGNGLHLSAGATPLTTEDEPPIPPPPAGVRAKLWDGSAWAAAGMKTWDGSAWATAGQGAP